MTSPPASVVVGIDNGATSNNATVLEESGRFLVDEMVESPSRVKEGTEAALDALEESFALILALTGIERSRVTAVGLDVTMQCQLTANNLRQFAESPLENVQFLWKLIQIWQGGNASQRPILHDPLAVAVTVKPDLVTTAAGTVAVELKGTPEQTYGMTVFRRNATGTVRVAQEVSSATAVEFFMQRVVAAPR